MIIYTVDALAGAGKTYQLIQYALKQAKFGSKIAIAQPSKDLLNETYTSIEVQNNKKVKVSRIDSSVTDNVTASVIDHLNDSAQGTGEILLLTHKTLLSIPYWNNAKEWHLIIDEAIDPIVDMSYNNSQHHELITSHINLEAAGATYSLATPKKPSTAYLKKAASNEAKDDYTSVHVGICAALISDHFDVYVHSENYDKIESKKRKDQSVKKMLIFTEIKPSIFKDFQSVTMMAAMMSERAICYIWEKHGVEFQPHPALTNSMRYTKHDGSNVSIYYFTEHKWSKKYALTDIEEINPLARIAHEARQIIGDESFIFSANNSLDSRIAADWFGENGTRMPVISHGLNTYQGHNNVVFTPATNPAPAFYAFAKFRGLEPADVDMNVYLQIMYQGIMRCSLRDTANTAPKRVFVPDRAAAEYLARYFEGATVQRVGSIADSVTTGTGGRTGKYVSDAARAKHHRQRQAAEKKLADALRETGQNPAAKCFSAIASVYSTDLYRSTINTNDEFITQLAESHKQVIKTKDAAMLISPSSFKTVAGSSTTRGIENVESVYGIWFDVDGGAMKMNDVKGIFPHLRIVMFHTFSGGNRYRIFIPTKTPMTVEVDKLIKRELLDHIEKNGFSHDKARDNFSGIDVSKLNPASFFYMPATPQGKKGNVFDRSHNDDAGSELDPESWLKHAPDELLIGEEVKPDWQPNPDSKLAAIRRRLAAEPTETNREAEADAAIETYRRVQKGTGERNHAFFILGVKLKKIGYSFTEIESILRKTANDGDREKQVKSIINTLRKKNT